MACYSYPQHPTSHYTRQTHIPRCASWLFGDNVKATSSLRSHLHQASASMQSQRCYDASDIGFIENNETNRFTSEWGCKPFWSNPIAILLYLQAELTLVHGVNGPLRFTLRRRSVCITKQLCLVPIYLRRRIGTCLRSRTRYVVAWCEWTFNHVKDFLSLHLTKIPFSRSKWQILNVCVYIWGDTASAFVLTQCGLSFSRVGRCS